MNVVYSSSDSYAMCTGISLYSLFANNQNVNNLDVYILSTDISDSNKKKLYDTAEKFARKIQIIDAKSDFIRESERLHLPLMRGAYNTYSRIILNTWFSSLDKIMVIDSDTMVCGSLINAWNHNIDNYYVAAVPEIAMYGKFNHMEDSNLLNKLDMYYNMGICVINLKKWRDDSIDDLIYNKIQKETYPFKIADQSIINKYLSNGITRLPLQYNFYSPLHNVSFETVTRVFCEKKVFTKEEFETAKQNPSIIHYFGHSYERPWFRYSVSLRKAEYLQVKSLTPWASLPLSKWRSSGSLLFSIYDLLCYLMLSLGLYGFCLKFRYQVGQQVKDKLHKSRK